MLLALDGQAHYSTAQIARKWTVVDSTDCTWSIANEGRWGGTNPCLKRVSTSEMGPTPGALTFTPTRRQSGIRPPVTTGVCGFACKVLDLTRVEPLSGALIEFWEGSTLHCYYRLNADGTLTLVRKGPSIGETDLVTSVGAVPTNAWVYLEFKWFLAVDAGSMSVRANGEEVLAYSGGTMSDASGAGGVGFWTSVRLLGVRSLPPPFLTLWMNDWYLCDQAGSGDQLRDFLGDIKVQTLIPNGAGASTGWIANTGTNWDATEEIPGDDDTTYVSTATAGARDLYTFTDMPPGIPLGFQACLLTRKDLDGAAEIQPSMRSGGTTHDGPSQGIASAVTYGYMLQPYDTNPITGARATSDEINAAQFGVLRA